MVPNTIGPAQSPYSRVLALFLGLIGQVKEVVPHPTPENCLEAPSNTIHKLTQNLAVKLKKLSKFRKGIPIMLGAFFFICFPKFVYLCRLHGWVKGPVSLTFLVNPVVFLY